MTFQTPVELFWDTVLCTNTLYQKYTDILEKLWLLMVNYFGIIFKTVTLYSNYVYKPVVCMAAAVLSELLF